MFDFWVLLCDGLPDRYEALYGQTDRLTDAVQGFEGAVTLLGFLFVVD